MSQLVSSQRHLFQELTRQEMEKVDDLLSELFNSQQPYYDKIDISIFSDGKQLRPMLLLLSAKMHLSTRINNMTISESIISAAAGIELMHIGSILHDDIIDNAANRRGYPTISSRNGNGMALLLGDLQFAGAVKFLIDSIREMENVNLLRRFIDTAVLVCQGEIDEYLTAYSSENLLTRYFDIIHNKTAVLISLSCEAGAILTKAEEQEIRAMKDYGRDIGLAFQIVDDILDFVGSDAIIGKGILSDLSNKRFSLPILYALESLPNDNAVERILRGDQVGEDGLLEASQEVISSGGIHRAYEMACTLTDNAKRTLETYPDTEFKEAFTEMASFVVERKL